jgi:hypothetical protein
VDDGRFYFPVLFVIPELAEQATECRGFLVTKRLWETSTFDLATLATKHRLHLPYQLMDVLLSRCNTEISIEATSHEEAISLFGNLRLALYTEGLSPFLSPFVTTHSINEYSGINSRDSGLLRKKLPEGMQEGLTSDSGTLEAWPLELSLDCIILADSLTITAALFQRAATKAKDWQVLCESHSSLKNLQDTIITAPKITSLSQSLLHLWCGLESLFPAVNTELSFKLALYLTQLVQQGPQRRAYFSKVRASYSNRCRVSHGSAAAIKIEEWKGAWEIAMDTCNAMLSRGVMFTEDALLADLLS